MSAASLHGRHSLVACLLLTALMSQIVVGCDDVPNTVTMAGGASSPAPSPSPSASGSPGAAGDPAASGTVEANPSATPTAATDVPDSAQPVASASVPVMPTPTPRPTPAPLSTPVPAVKLSFLSPTSSTDFTQDKIQVKLKIEVPLGTDIKIDRMALLYDGVELETKKGGTDLEFILDEWNPHVVKDFKGSKASVVTPKRFGQHTLRGEVYTAAGARSEVEFTFDKPLLFKGWVNTSPYNFAVLPTLTPPRAHHAVVGVTRPSNGDLFAWFGVSATTPEFDGLFRLPINPTLPRGWSAEPATGTNYRRAAGVAGINNLLYLIGGEVRTGPGALIPSNDVSVYDITRNEFNAAVPDLPTTLVDPAVTVHQGFLYACGGYLDTSVSKTVSTLYRIELDGSGAVKGLAWTKLPDVPKEAGRSGARLVGIGRNLYMVGGTKKTGVKDRTIMRYNLDASAWSEEPDLLPRGVDHPVAVNLAEKLWIFGGDDSDATKSVSSTAIRYDPLTRTAKAMGGAADFPTGRERAGAGYAIVDNYLYVVGGYAYDPAGAPVYLSDVIRADAL